MQSDFVNVKCVILAGAFSGEKLFEVPTVGGGTFVGGAPVGYYSRLDGGKLKTSEPRVGERLEGQIAARVIRNGNSTARVAFPDGEYADVDTAILTEREPIGANFHFKFQI